jgi:ATP-binding cassette subfamily G (WHITE) protein 2 (PDR)
MAKPFSVLSTSQAPSFQEFDRLLFLAKGGKTVYFGNIGQNSNTLLDYFENQGARKCGARENPAEYMLEIVNEGTQPKTGKEWSDVWKESGQATAVFGELDRIHSEMGCKETVNENVSDATSEFAAPFWTQLCIVTYRIFQQYWRMPSYIYSKFGLAVASGLFVGFSFWKSDTSLQGMQNNIFSVFMICAIFSSLVQQVNNLRPSPSFSTKERSNELYESRLCPSS